MDLVCVHIEAAQHSCENEEKGRETRHENIREEIFGKSLREEILMQSLQNDRKNLLFEDSNWYNIQVIKRRSSLRIFRLRLMSSSSIQ